MLEALYDLTVVHTRSAQVLDVQESDSDDKAGMLEVKLAPYDVEAERWDGMSEVFSRACFAAACGNPSRVKVSNQGHDRRNTVGDAVQLRDEADGIYGTLRILPTALGKDLM